MSKKRYTEEQKAAKVAKATALHDNEKKSWDDAAAAVGVARLTLFNWMHPKAKKGKVGRPKGKKGKVGRPRKNGELRVYVTGPVEDEVVAAALRTTAAQKAMFQKIIGWAEREMAKL